MCRYGWGILGHMVRTAGIWPIVSYTITSWNLLTARYSLLLASGIFRSSGELAAQLAQAAEFLRFPSLVQNSVTVTLWWAVIVPVLYTIIPVAKLKDFRAFNSSFFLITIHGLNLPSVIPQCPFSCTNCKLFCRRQISNDAVLAVR